MAANALNNYKEDFFLLLEAGFIAVNAADEDSATKLFKAAALLKPESTFPKVGFGYMHLCKLEIKQAIASFREVLAKEPQNEMAKALLGICLSFTPTELSQGEKTLADLSRSSPDSGIKKLANTALDFVEKFVKKSPSPVQPQKPKHKQM